MHPLPHRPSATSRSLALLVVLTPEQRQDFLGGPLLAQLEALASDLRFVDPLTIDEAEFGRELSAANPEVLIGCWGTPPLPAQLPPRLRYVCYLTGSVKRLVSREHIERGLVVTNWGGSIARTVAEGALLHILSCLRNAAYWAVRMHEPGVAAWKDGRPDTRSLFSRRVGLHGFGPVARELVRLLKPWGCAVSAFAPDLTPELTRTYGVTAAATLEALFSENEIVVELAPLIPETRGIVTEKLLRSIPAGGIFVNVGRGAVVDEDALLTIAREGRISVGLDVFTVEPLPAESGFRGLPRVQLTPHLAGPTIDQCPEAGAFALRNLQAYAAGRPLEAVVTTEMYDQST